VLAARGVPLLGVHLYDGSGLSSWDRLTGRAIAALLLSAWSDSRIHNAFVGSLAIAGVNGTLVDRMRTGPAHRVVRAKTGTTSLASALSGYVGSKYVFSILFNGNPVPVYSAEAAEDRFAQILAGTL
jgi:D-alanyl-D-alanine carboxypeptidase/D-alanyl-D-alanine-endopeptidase (penicillin-binding protein 4)